MSKLTEACSPFVPGPLKRYPKIAIIVMCVAALGSIGTFFGGFTEAYKLFFGSPQPLSEQQAYITHQQFNTLMIPLVKNVSELEETVTKLREQLAHARRSSESRASQPREESRAPTSNAPVPADSLVVEEVPNVLEEKKDQLKDALERVQELQVEQRQAPTKSPQ